MRCPVLAGSTTGFLQDIEPEIENDLGSLYVNIRKFPKEIQSASNGELYKFPWVSMNDLFTGRVADLPEFAKLAYDQKRAIERDIQKMRDYKFPVQIIQE